MRQPIRKGRPGNARTLDPTGNLVVVEPYRFVRDPMICGVALLLIAQALVWGS